MYKSAIYACDVRVYYRLGKLRPKVCVYVSMHICVNICVYICVGSAAVGVNLCVLYVGKVLNQTITMITMMAAFTLQS